MHIPAFVFMDDNPSYANGDNPGIVIQTKLAYVGRTVNNARIQKEVERRSTEPHRHITPAATILYQTNLWLNIQGIWYSS